MSVVWSVICGYTKRYLPFSVVGKLSGPVRSRKQVDVISYLRSKLDHKGP